MLDAIQILEKSQMQSVADCLVCDHCYFAAPAPDYVSGSYTCQACGHSIPSVRSFFPPSVHSLIDLMQGFQQNYAQENHDTLAVVLAYCSFIETLMQNFMIYRMSKMGISSDMQQCILDNHPTMTTRMEKLFPLLTGRSWSAVLTRLGDDVQKPYKKLDDFYRTLAQARNLFLQRGNRSAMKFEMGKQSLENIQLALRFFMDLHNEFVYKAL